MSEETLKSVLIVDDTPTNIDILMEILAEEYDVSVAIDGESALESVKESIPDIILLDIMMPGMDGYEVCTRLKNDDTTKDIPVIFITAMNDIKDEIRGFEVGAIDYITKPFSPPVVQRRVESALTLEAKKKELANLAKKLSKYLAPQVYVSIFRGEQDAAIESRRKKLTIFFSDIVNFTSTTEGMEAEDLTDLLNSYLDEMSTIALKHGGTIDKFIGDAILIFFGDPLSRGLEEDALACVSMAIEMRERLKELQKKWYSYGIQNPFQVRVGISTGYCTVGNFGSKNRMDYTIIGNQVNTASRLESSAKPGQIIISHETWSLIKNKIRCLKSNLITVKGLHHPIQTYLVNDFIKEKSQAPAAISAEQILEDAASMEITERVQDAFFYFDKDKSKNTLIITEEGAPVGILYASQLREQLRDETTKAAYLNQKINSLSTTKVLTVDSQWPIDEVLSQYLHRTERELYDPVIVIDDHKYQGIIPAYKLIKLMNE